MSDGSEGTNNLHVPQSPESPASTAPIPIAVSPRGPSIALIFIAAAAASFLFGVALATGTRPQADHQVLAQADVGPSGGVIRFDGGEIRVPDGALTAPERIVVRRSVHRDQVRVEAAEQPVLYEPGRLVAYTFEPTDVRFARPVHLTFRLPTGSRNGSVFARRDSTIVLLQGTIDPARATATVEVTDFAFRGGDG